MIPTPSWFALLFAVICLLIVLSKGALGALVTPLFGLACRASA